MWKSIVLCISLFGGAAMGLALGARFVEASALPAAAAIGLCVIGVVLILAAPSNEVSLESASAEALTLKTVTQPVAAATATDIVEAASSLLPTRVSNRTPTRPFPLLNA
jgi:hypothetical protein